MKAARYDPSTGKVEVQRIPLPQLENDLMLVKTISSGLCHSDMLVLHGKAPFTEDKAVTIGHEAVGEVIEIGRDVKDIFKVGDKVGFLNGLRACWKCEGCAKYYAFCEAGKFKMQGFACDGFLQEYILVDPNAAFVLPSGVDPRKFAPICCAGITSYNSVKVAKLEKCQWIGMVGCGGVGQLGIRYAVAKGLNVVAIDIDDSILETAKQAGVKHIINSRTNQNAVEEIKKLVPHGRGVDAVVVYAGVNAGYRFGQQIVKTGGRFVSVGVPEGEISFPAHEVPLERYTIHGASNHGTRPMFTECAQFTKDHGIESPSQLFKIEQIGEMITLMEEGRMQGKRLIVDFSS
ncbi:hypothetical protein A1O7_01811 [Cladophialophora yegresii CBS 114405]|uniref:Enoyl reductase (ER) domain-containing protein n=1 Tax=Cladophialophora yegresii CBS 114405 TaxID=1182544 RepID=W9WKF2_9EURO|nr:uncharacterized protein A1O7_01811 [Cladophialophora yegresii CBS 114405]EXJ65470.1 hypothetical protein A1O7_01811 [Cladophialophora yegresii CBS 114405]